MLLSQQDLDCSLDTTQDEASSAAALEYLTYRKQSHSEVCGHIGGSWQLVSSWASREQNPRWDPGVSAVAPLDFLEGDPAQALNEGAFNLQRGSPRGSSD